ncbi:MAG TPA: alpha/beta hydrolase [Actinomycetota bacterium]|nr:alpha/beta hydrolase [Actinomycetota bacterium]
MEMSTFALVPGAWLGGWAWDEVTDRLRANGHEVHPVTLTGLGERANLASPEIDLERHVADIVGALEEADLRDVVLVGHSYGGIPVTGAADRIPDRLAAVVYVDSGPALDGTAYIETLPPPLREATERHVKEEGDGWRLPMPSWEELETLNGAGLQGLDDATRRSIRERATPQPFKTYTQAIALGSPARTTLPHVLISCSFPPEQVREFIASGHPWFVELSGPQWSFVEVPTSHWPMFSAPEELANALDQIPSG